jgi:hypothetical protein
VLSEKNSFKRLCQKFEIEYAKDGGWKVMYRSHSRRNRVQLITREEMDIIWPKMHNPGHLGL